jgi:hypothetical protein
MPRVVEGRVYKDLRQVSTVPHLHCHLSNRRQLPTPRNSAMSYIPSNGRYVRTRDGQSEIWATTENGRVTLHPATTRPVRPASSSSEQPFETRTPSPTARRLPLGIRDGAPGSSSSVEEMRPDGRFPSPRTQPSRGGPPFANRPQVNPAYPHGDSRIGEPDQGDPPMGSSPPYYPRSLADLRSPSQFRPPIDGPQRRDSVSSAGSERPETPSQSSRPDSLRTIDTLASYLSPSERPFYENANNGTSDGMLSLIANNVRIRAQDAARRAAASRQTSGPRR